MILTIMVSLVGCADKEAITDAVTRIEANELTSALKVVKDMDDKTIKAGKDEILTAIINELTPYLDTNSWISTSYCLIDDKTISDLEKYKSIIDALSLDVEETNIDDFLTKALSLKEYVKWNSYYKANDDYLTEAKGLMDQGAVYRSSPTIASRYYKQAYDVCMDAYYIFNGSSDAGMKEAADLYYNFAVQTNGIISRSGTTAAQDNAYNNASSAYQRMTSEYIDALDDVINTCEDFPNKLY